MVRMRIRHRRVLAVLLLALSGFSCTRGDDQTREERGSAEAGDMGVQDAPKECSREPIPLQSEEVRAVAFARGTGPVFVGLGTAGAVHYTEDTREHRGWYYNKTLWAISPRYQGAVIVTGEQLDGSNELRFNASSGFPGEKLSALKFEESNGAKWRYGPSDTLIRADGCYAFRIAGDDFVDWVTFIARS
jgi:hypothetical protein